MKNKNILFLTLVKIESIRQRGIYHDLMRTFAKEGFNVYIVSPIERREGRGTTLREENNVRYLGVRTFNIQKTNVLEKGLGTLALELQFLQAIKRHFNNVKFDLVLYSTPPITFTKIIKYIKSRDNALSYLLLKDIFPQNAVDLKMIKEGGFIHKFFLKKEKLMYEVSDRIGCMSEANVDYILKHNPEINLEKIEINPNSLEPIVNYSITQVEINDIRKKYNIPTNVTVFVYGGNLGKPQGLDFLLKVIEDCKNTRAFFLIVGGGTEYKKIETWFKDKGPNNALLLKNLPKTAYDQMLIGCDVGMIFLRPEFTIPNFPSRLLSYLEHKLPIISATDKTTDIGKIAEKNNFGISLENGDLARMLDSIDFYIDNPIEKKKMGEIGFNFMSEHYNVRNSFKAIVKYL